MILYTTYVKQNVVHTCACAKDIKMKNNAVQKTISEIYKETMHSPKLFSAFFSISFPVFDSI